jgi:hypothetical protein
MMKTLLILLLLGLGYYASAFESNSLNLIVPSDLDRNSLVFEVQHRFYGSVTEDPLGNFFGLDIGGNVNLGIRYALLKRLELKVSYTTFEKEYRIGASYAYRTSNIPLQAQIDLQYFNFERSNETFGNLYYGVAIQSGPVSGIFTPTLNVGFDGYNEKFGLGIGLEAGFACQFGPIERISVTGEYFPVLQAEEPITGANNCFAAGVKVDTYGHHFMIQASNGWNIGSRRLMLGTSTDDIYLGFNIQRLLRF